MTGIAQEFRRNGYSTALAPLTPDALTMLRRICDRLLEEPPEDGGNGLHNIGLGRRRQFLRHRHRDFPELERFLLAGPPARIASEILGGPSFLFNEQFVVKGPQKGASFAWHQDGAYVGFAHRPYLSLWIALDDASEENGCLWILPRDLDARPGLDVHEPIEGTAELNGYFGEDPGLPLPCAAGAMVAFSSLTLHRSGPNVTERPRRAYLCQYSPEPIRDPASGDPKRFATPVRDAGAEGAGG